MGFITTGPGSPLAFSAASGGKIYAFNSIAEASVTVIAPANASRQSILFHNPGSSDIFIAPSQALLNGSNVTLTPSNAARGGCFRIYGNGGSLVITGECQGEWQAFAVTGAGASNPLTVMDNNV
jgi:hypothetical protein